MKFNLESILLAVLLAWLLLVGLPQPGYANPITMDPHTGFFLRGQPLWILWVVSPVVETAVIIFLLHRRFTGLKAYIKPVLLIIILNLITFPITQTLAVKLFSQDHLYRAYLAEFFPLITEFLVLGLLFKSLYWNRDISARVTPKSTLLLSAGANLATFILGFGFYFYFPAPLNAY